MRALVFRGPRHIEVAEVPTPTPEAGQVVVRLHGCGVCGSNLPVWEGRPWFQYPFGPGAPGHEGWGHVAAIGPEVTSVREGEPVAILSYNAFADYDVAPAHQVVRLPGTVRGAFPGEAIACAVNVLKRCDIAPGQRVAVVGVGFLGALIVRLATIAGAHITAVGRRPFSLSIARAYGARATVEFRDVSTTVAAARTANGGADYDCVIEAAGAQRSLDVSAQLTRERGRLIIAGYHQDGARTIDLQSWNWRGIDVINAHERDTRVYVAGMRDAVDLVGSGALDLEPLLTHSVPLEHAAQAFEAAEARPAGFMKAMVWCND